MAVVFAEAEDRAAATTTTEIARNIRYKFYRKIEVSILYYQMQIYQDKH